ncbi:glycosyltransferase family 4 protein [Aliagarivorans taiwanensis]|uniref:glycosyltransferase family 4 protein n=1 Tax=Aliagarivorans taiwanensis TaxID=561966 RepID=UPI0006856198|nr:glycosyltransferase family 4 protein [Aliagarivorans taiwanensis]
MSNHSVLHICLSKGWGGLEMYPIRMGTQFQQRGWRVLGICLAGTPVDKAMREQGFKVFTFASKAKALLAVSAINRWLNRQQCQLMHCHKSGDLLLAALLDSLHRRRVIFTEHMGGSSSKRDLFHRWVYRHVDQLLSISEFTKAKNLKNLPIDPTKIARLWLGTAPPPAELSTGDVLRLRRELGLPDTAPVIGTLGRIDPGKGQLQLLDAFKQLVEHGDEQSHLLIVGGLQADQGADLTTLGMLKDKIAEYGLAQRVHLPGFRKDIHNMLSVMDVVCLLSKEEAFGLTAIEAMMAGRVVLGADSGAIPELLDNPALTVPFDNPAKIATTLEKLIADDDKLALAAGLKTRAEKHFLLETHLAQLEKYYLNGE